MKVERKPFPWPLFVAVAIIAIAIGYALGAFPAERESWRPKMPDVDGSRAQADDAMRRWARKGIGGRRTPEQMLQVVRETHAPTLMAFPTKNCIQLILEPGSVGGEPIYCYRPNSLDLIEEYSDVE